MVFEHIEKLKQEFTDKFVVVDEGRPELRRFNGLTGTVKTVNMNGRALVEFDGHENIGWYDIEIDYLKVIDQPLAKKDKPREKPVVPKTSGAKSASQKPSALEQARAADGVKKKSGAMSVDDVLAAARSQKSGAAAAAEPPVEKTTSTANDPKSMSVAEVLAAARGEQDSGAPAASTSDPTDVAAIMEAARKPKAKAASSATSSAPKASEKDPKTMSVAEVLAAARGEKSGDAAVAPPTETESVEPVAPSVAAEDPAPTAPIPVDELPTDVAGTIEYCRHHDSG